MKTKLGYAFCASFCTLGRSMQAMKELAVSGEYEILPIASENLLKTDTRFGRADEIKAEIEEICGKKIISSIKDAEPIGPKGMIDVLVISPCTGNSLAKMAHGITDTAVTMAAKSHLRTHKPTVIALATNDALSANLSNISALLSRKNLYFVPLLQDDVKNKPDSLVAEFELLPTAIDAARRGEQLRPLFTF